MQDNGVGSNANVYAELGSTWRNLMTNTTQAAHLLGIGQAHLVEADGAVAGVVNVRRDGERAVGRAESADHEATPDEWRALLR